MVYLHGLVQLQGGPCPKPEAFHQDAGGDCD